MTGSTIKPVVVTITDAADHPWPGLSSLEHQATVIRVFDDAALGNALPEADILLATDFRTEALRRYWPSAKRLRWIHATSAGVDTLMFPELVASDIPVTNARGIFDRGVAEYVLGLVLLFAKDFNGTLQRQRRSIWDHRETEGIASKQLLVIGVGSIGGCIGRLANAAGLKVVGIGRQAREDVPGFERVVDNESLDLELSRADFVVIAAPLTAITRGLFGPKQFASMKPSARLINVGRGPIVHTEALVDALRQKTIAGAALDVMEQEPLPREHPLWLLPQVVVSPHMAGDLVGWKTALSVQFLDNFARWQRHEPLQNVVNKERLRSTTGK